MVIAFAHRAIYRALSSTWGTKIPVIVCCRTDPVGHYDSISDKIQIKLLFPYAAGCRLSDLWTTGFFSDHICRIILYYNNAVNPKYMGVERPVERRKAVVQSGRLVSMKNQANVD